ncbi:MAG: hypothetical protein ABIW16_05240 [Sphingomicrobium sp.]
MRAILMILILGIVVLIAAVATGMLNINQIRGAKAPTIAATGNGVVAKGGQAPAFDIETGSVAVGTKSANVTVPVPNLQVNPAGGPAAAAPAAQPGNSVQGNGM